MYTINAPPLNEQQETVKASIYDGSTSGSLLLRKDFARVKYSLGVQGSLKHRHQRNFCL